MHLALAVTGSALAVTAAAGAAVGWGVSVHPTQRMQSRRKYLSPQLQLAQLALLTRTKEYC